MTRQDVIKTFPTATAEQIDAILASHHAEVQQEKDKNKELKDASKELETTKAELEELRAKADSGAPEDWQKQMDKLIEANNKAQQTIKNMQLKEKLVGKGFSEEDADKFIKTLNEGGDIAEVMGEFKSNVISAYDKERMDKTPDPSGSAGDNPDEKDSAEKLVSGLFGDSSNSQTDILANYM